MPTPVWISLGSNLGDRHAILAAALRLLNQTPGVVVSQVSSFHETLPVGGPAGQGAFLNAAARLETTLMPRELLGVTQEIEDQLGRVRTVRWGERTLDLDLLIFGTRFVDEPDLKLPHPRLAVRRFVLEPLVEIAPDATYTMTRQKVADLLAHINLQPRILMLDSAVIGLNGQIHHSITEALSGQAISLPAESSEDLASMPQGSTWANHRETLRQLDTLQAFARDGSIRPERWSVCDFAVDVAYLKRAYSAAWLRKVDQSFLEQAVIKNPNLWFMAQFARLVNIPEPTLIVAMLSSGRPRKPGTSLSPIYWPEATDHDAIVAEIIAVCRGIEAV